MLTIKHRLLPYSVGFHSIVHAVIIDIREGGYGKAEERRSVRSQCSCIFSGKHKLYGLSLQEVKMALKYINTEWLYGLEAAGVDEDLRGVMRMRPYSV